MEKFVEKFLVNSEISMIPWSLFALTVTKYGFDTSDKIIGFVCSHAIHTITDQGIILRALTEPCCIILASLFP